MAAYTKKRPSKNTMAGSDDEEGVVVVVPSEEEEYASEEEPMMADIDTPPCDGDGIEEMFAKPVEPSVKQAIIDGAKNSLPLHVEATKTPEELALQTAGHALDTVLHELILDWYSKRPMLTVWHEPSKQEISARVHAELANTDDDILIAAGNVKAAIDAERRAAGVDKQKAINASYLREIRKRLIDASDRVRIMLEAEGGTTSHKSSLSTPSTRKQRVSKTWADKAQALNVWAEKHGLNGFVLVDLTEGGYQGDYHAVRIYPDGKIERVEYSRATHKTKDTGEFVDSIIWFKNNKGERPAYAVQAMYGVLLVDRRGAIREIDGINIKRRNGMSHLGDYELICDSLNI